MAFIDLTISFIGCGHMGGAVLYGLLDALSEETKPLTHATRFIACTKSAASASRLQDNLSGRLHGANVKILHNNPIEAMTDADVVILGFKPFMARDILGKPGVLEALDGKLVISMLAGLSASDIQSMIVGSSSRQGPHVAKVVPNVASRYRRSMTILELSDSAILPPHQAELVEGIFSQVGWTKWILPEALDTASMVMTASIAVLSVPIEGLLDGSVVEGLRRPDAMELTIHGLHGLVAMLESGEHPATLRESISSPKGCTIQSLLTVEKAGARAIFAQSLIDGVRSLTESKKRDR